MWRNMCSLEKSKTQKYRVTRKKLKSIVCLASGVIYNSDKAAAADLGLGSVTTIKGCANGDKKSYKNYKFKYLQDIPGGVPFLT